MCDNKMKTPCTVPHKRKTTQHSLTAVDTLNSVSVFKFRQAERVKHYQKAMTVCLYVQCVFNHFSITLPV